MAMLPAIEERKELIVDLCRRYRVRRLELFGSAASDAFDADRSDLDFLVEFEPLEQGQYADCYFGLLEALEDAFGHRVDLVMTRSIKNRYFLAGIADCRRLLYAA
jgi:uncharacterized protein